jgi:hypothetical protein
VKVEENKKNQLILYRVARVNDLFIFDGLSSQINGQDNERRRGEDEICIMQAPNLFLELKMDLPDYLTSELVHFFFGFLLLLLTLNFSSFPFASLVPSAFLCTFSFIVSSPTLPIPSASPMLAGQWLVGCLLARRSQLQPDTHSERERITKRASAYSQHSPSVCPSK